MKSRMEDIQVRLDFDRFPKEHTCDGAGTSPLITIDGLKTPYLAIIIDDPDAPRGTFTHWVIWNISTGETVPKNISKVERPPELDGALQGRNSGNTIGYMGPCPPQGKPHHYFVKMYGLDALLNLKSGATKQQLEAAMEGHVRQYGETMATYQRL